jgi:hypothetical protein
LVERWIEDPSVGGSTPSQSTKKEKMEEERKLTFEEKLEGWRNRMTLARTIARILAVIVQCVITYLLLKT